jgi:ABC-2 type transport system permease protein
MSIEADVGAPSPAAQATTSAAARQGRPYWWSVRRELWENRSIWIAPLAAAGFVLFGFTISLVHKPHTMKALASLSPEKQMALRFAPFGIVAAALILTTVVVGVFYCLGTLYNERRDRSILFWKSMPVSDLTTVLAKATIPLVILPVIAFAVVCATQLVMLLFNSIALASHQTELTQLWSTVPLFRLWGIVLYALGTLTLWQAPLYAYFLALSASVKKGPFLWAVLPPIAFSVFEKLAFDTSYVSKVIHDRLFGSFGAAFTGVSGHTTFGDGKAGGSPHSQGFHLPVPDPVRFFTTPGLWIGLVVAVGLFALAVWLRRRREPI